MQPGYRIEHYVVIEKIGQGGQATVWSAYDERLKRTVAIKTIRLTENDQVGAETSPETSDLTNPDRFREEAQTIAALEHPSILPVYAFGQDNDWLYIVMRYMAAGSLRDLLSHAALDVAQVISLLNPIAGALDLAHRSRILHRDLKSANILLDADQHPYLADFGLSMTIGTPSETGSGGTLAYMSPEQILGDPLDHRSDLYALGILMYEMLIGHMPLTANGQAWNLQRVMHDTPLPVPETIPLLIAQVLKRATAIDPEQRYPSAAELVGALIEAAQPDMLETKVVTPTDPALLALKEADDLLHKAQERWADGAGRFRLEAGDFQYIDSFYAANDDWGVELNDAPKRLMLRAALEHGYHLKIWWAQVDDLADQRTVALQTLTSDLGAARLRAIERLTLIEDADPPAIPVRVASVIRTDPERAVRVAGIALLERRAGHAADWGPPIQADPTAETLTYLAVNDPDPGVAEAAARSCARLRLTTAAIRLREQAATENQNAWRALLWIRDEVNRLPSEVPAKIRALVFLRLSWQQLFAEPLSLFGRYAGASLGFGIGLATIVYALFNDAGGILAAQRVGTALAAGALYGALIGIGTSVATEFAARLRVWTRLGRSLLAWAAGTVLCSLAFAIFHRYFYFLNAPDTVTLLLSTLVFTAGFAITPVLTHRTVLRSLAATVGVLIALALGWQIGRYPLIYLVEGRDYDSLLLSAWLAVTFGLLTFLPEWWRAARRLNK